MSGIVVYRIDPLRDPRWVDLVERHPCASVFHTQGWLEALRRTYGYNPIALTTSAPGEKLKNGVVFCRIRSWITGRRMVSLPFSDHCQPLVESEEELDCLVSALQGERDARAWRYVEIRPTVPPWGSPYLENGQTYCFHRLDLRSATEELFDGFHKSCVQRKIRRAEREALVYEDGRSEALLQTFYELHVPSRRRLGLPSQPLVWFRNLIESMGDKLKIRVASKDGHAVASIITLRHNGTMVYKYGCSDRNFNNLGGMHLLLWRAVEEAKRDGLVEFDLGRSDWNNPGLIHFKDRWGAAQYELTYLRRPQSGSRLNIAFMLAAAIPAARMGKQIAALIPRELLMHVGRVFYRHLG